ncbi:minor capsid protein [Clostridium septicum]|uniref:minor capsid protein n=1 Tax=Clostridium septicum TaxID=1504 RepID=UPI00082D07F9|nr:minor capsid protein [Clostridium septicum]WLF70884.1 minor capsid protein [Clostridium septicum]
MKSRSNAYWERRANARMENYHKGSDETIYKINKAYDKAIKDINEDINKIFYKYQLDSNLNTTEARELLNSKISNKELDSIRARLYNIQDEELKQYMMAQLNANAYKARITRLEALKESIYINTKIAADVEIKQSTKLYTDNINKAYYTNLFDIQKGLGIGFNVAKMPLETIQEILKNNWSGKHYSKRIWNNTDVLAEKLEEVITAGLMSGKSSRRMALELQDLTDYGKFSCERIIRTETTYVTNMADIESYKECGIEKLIFLATLDLRTSKRCREMDGKIIDVDKAIPGENIPPLHPHCRSTTRAYFENMKRLQRRARDPETGKNYIVPEDMNYNEWYDKFVIDKYGKDKAEVFEKMIKNKTSDKKQYEEYKIVLKDMIPKSFDKFRGLKYTDVNKYQQIEDNFKAVNLYKIDFGYVSPQKILELDRQAFAEKRNNQISKYKKQGNFAVLEYNGKTRFASSKIASEEDSHFIKYKGEKEKLVLLKEHREFVTKEIGEIVDGKINEIPRYYDTEAKFFEFLNDKIKDEDIKEIFMLSEKAMCESCKDVAKQFIRKYPNIKVNVISGKSFDGWKGR